MILQEFVLMVVVLLPSLFAFKITFTNGLFAEYELLKVEEHESTEHLKGGQAFVRFAKVIFLSNPVDFEFQEGDEFALKIALPGQEVYMSSEQKAFDYIRNNAPGGSIDGVVKAEKWMGESSDLQSDKNLVLPGGVPKRDAYVIIVMERLGIDLTKMFFTKKLSEAELEHIYDQLCTVLGKMRKIGFLHGDVKPNNILFKRSNAVQDGICLADLGLAVFPETDIKTCAGDPYLVSRIQVLMARPPTCNDSEVSGAISIAVVATGYLPWDVLYNDRKLPKNQQKNNFHRERILVSKFEFIQNPFGSAAYPQDRIPSISLLNKIRESLRKATKDEIGNIQPQIEDIKQTINNSDDKGGCKPPCNLL